MFVAAARTACSEHHGSEPVTLYSVGSIFDVIADSQSTGAYVVSTIDVKLTDVIERHYI